MPTYEYRCPQGHEFEKFQRMSDPPVAECPECGREAERMLSAGAGLLFRGEGFYITDYRSDSYKKAAEKEKGGGEKTETGGEKGGEKGGGKTAGKSGGESGGGSGGAPGGGSGGGDAGGGAADTGKKGGGAGKAKE